MRASSPRSRLGPSLLVLALLGPACGSDEPIADTPDAAADATAPTTAAPATAGTPGGEPGGDRFPDVLDAVVELDPGTTTWTFVVTLSSPYDTPERYADGWRVVGPDGTVYGVHTLTHDHASEQPFTRRQTGVEIPADVAEVTIEGRDLANGFGGRTLTISLPTG